MTSIVHLIGMSFAVCWPEKHKSVICDRRACFADIFHLFIDVFFFCLAFASIKICCAVRYWALSLAWSSEMCVYFHMCSFMQNFPLIFKSLEKYILYVLSCMDL